MSEKKEHAVVSFSSGLDSSVCFYWALKKYEKVSALFFNYGQKALEKEREFTKLICDRHKVSLKEIDITFLSDYSDSALNSNLKEVPTDSVDIESKEKSIDSAKSVWVPNRNGVFISVCASFAEAKGALDVILGFNKEEAETFPDNSETYIEKANDALIYSTQARVKVISPTISLNKREIYLKAKELGVDFNYVWSCYFSNEKHCGECESCKRYERARKSDS